MLDLSEIIFLEKGWKDFGIMKPREEKEEGELGRPKARLSKMTNDDDKESDDKLASAAKGLVHLMQVCTLLCSGK